MDHTTKELDKIGVFQWESIADGFQDSNLFLGNGFSISLCSRLSYKSLFDEFKVTTDPELLRIFNSFKTFNFELVMQNLNNTEVINDILGIHSAKIEKLRDALRSGLIKTVQENHPAHSEIYYPQLLKLGYELLEFRDIFTTNYDVFLYKSILQVISEYQDQKLEIPFQDFFYEKVNPTQLKFSSVVPYNNPRSVYYLHGSLFLYIYLKISAQLINFAS